MPITEQDIQAIQEKIHFPIGKPVWGVHRLFGSYIQFEVGEIRPSKSKYMRGEWSIEIQSCSWRLQTAQEVITASNDPHEKMDPALQELEGAIIVSFDIQVPSLLTTITFEGGLVLRLFPIHSEGKISDWELSTPDKLVLIVGPGSQWHDRRSDIPYSR